MLGQQIINGVMLGSVYAMVAVALTLSIGVLNFLNFSIPGLFMIGGMAFWALTQAGLHWFLAILAAVAIVAEHPHAGRSDRRLKGFQCSHGVYLAAVIDDDELRRILLSLEQMVQRVERVGQPVGAVPHRDDDRHIGRDRPFAGG